MNRCGNCKWKFSEKCTKWENDSGICEKWEKRSREMKLEKIEKCKCEFKEI